MWKAGPSPSGVRKSRTNSFRTSQRTEKNQSFLIYNETKPAMWYTISKVYKKGMKTVILNRSVNKWDF